jgi:signal transduction histidine kinase
VMRRDEADAANRAKSAFLANMSHELRTPLNAIIGFAQLIRDQFLGKLPERYVSYGGDIVVAGEHLLRIVNEILDISRIEAGKEMLEETVVALQPLVEACLGIVRERAAQGGVALRCDVPADLPALRVDIGKLRQVLINVLSNAVKFTLPGGSVSTAALIDADGTLRLRVADTGIGMDEAEVRIALEPFGQVESAFTRRHEGTGLGLPLAKRLVELLGGTLRLESRKGEGTTVDIVLPPARVLAGPAQEAA